MAGEVRQRVWLVTGASRGIGEAVARRAVSTGGRVALLARSDRVMELAEELGPDCLGCRADVASPEEVDAAVAAVVGRWGRIDCLVNNAGVHRGGKIGRLSDADWRMVLDVNLSGSRNTISSCIAHLGEGAAIVNVGAVVGFRGFPGDSAYAASKAGLAGLTRALAMELAPRGITVNLVVPGLVLTEMTGGLSPKTLEAMRRMIPMGRYGDPEEIAGVVDWVSRSRYMTGAIIPADGGLMSTFGTLG